MTPSTCLGPGDIWPDEWDRLQEQSRQCEHRTLGRYGPVRCNEDTQHGESDYCYGHSCRCGYHADGECPRDYIERVADVDALFGPEWGEYTFDGERYSDLDADYLAEAIADGVINAYNLHPDACPVEWGVAHGPKYRSHLQERA